MNYDELESPVILSEWQKLERRCERAEAELAAARAECLRRQTIIGEVALERDAARALLREVNARTQGTIAEYEEYLTRIDAALAAPEPSP